MDKSPQDLTAWVMTAAALIVAVYLFQENTDLRNQVEKIKTEYEGFKSGVLHAK